MKKYIPHLVFYVFSLGLCFLAFAQSDLTHTYTSSYAYLHGHFYDFYDYNKQYIGGNDYLPGTYLIFALWGLPLKLLGLMTSPELGFSVWQTSTIVEIFWYKLLLTTFFFLCALLIHKIVTLLEPNRLNNSSSPSIVFLSSPIAIFAVFIFSQYDVIGTFFTLLGLYSYFQKRFWRFAIFFSIAISFKYFAAVIYLPLVLLIEKHPAQLIKYGLIGLLATAIQAGFYWHSEIFQTSFLALAGGKIKGAHYSKLIYMGVLYLILCLSCFFSKPSLDLKNTSWARNAIFACTLSYAFLFVTIAWHPQWMFILMPFFALSVIYIRHQKAFLFFELAGYIAFIWLCVNFWPGNVDVTMLKNGVLRAYMPELTHLGASVLPNTGMSVAKMVFSIYLFSPFIFWACENWRLLKKTIVGLLLRRETQDVADVYHQPEVVLSTKQSIRSSSYSLWLIYGMRTLIACYFFLVVAGICLYTSQS